MKYTIFYSWQSDLPNNTNRGFIQSVIEKATKDINSSEEYELELSIDRDTQGVPGAPNITQIILDKIKKCDAFVADISIVTGDKEKGQRPSPNPNVLLELGYAVALLGWERIILFCNKVYGTNEDLPFDIRQHRRIEYRLLQEDKKSEIRKNLAKHFKRGLIELLEKGKRSAHPKSPNLDVFWYSFDFQGENNKKGVESEDIVLERMYGDSSAIKDEVEQEIIEATRIDGGVDPRWRDKVHDYIHKARAFINALDDQKNETKIQNYLIDANKEKARSVTLLVGNGGNAPASDIRVRVTLPEWLLAFEEFPYQEDILQKPKLPTPEPPRDRNFDIPFMSSVASQIAMSQINDLRRSLDIPPNLGIVDIPPPNLGIERTSACYLTESETEIYFWADDLLHKHSRANKGDRFYLMAKQNAPKGKFVLSGTVFCVEYDDWQDIELVIDVV